MAGPAAGNLANAACRRYDERSGNDSQLDKPNRHIENPLCFRIAHVFMEELIRQRVFDETMNGL